MTKIDGVRSKVQRMLTDSFGNVRVNKDNEFIISHGSAMVRVEVKEFAKEQVIVHILSFVLHDFRMSPDVYKWVATSGQESWFGAFAVLGGETDKPLIIVSHTLLGDYLDQGELENAVIMLLLVADKSDDELKSLFGGKRMTD